MMLRQLYDQIRSQIPRVTLSQNRRITLQAGADAFATETEFGIGAWLILPNRQDIWLSLLGHTQDLPEDWQHVNLQRHIISFETMAQCAILMMFNASDFRGVDFRSQSKVDNQASEAIIAQGFTQIMCSSALLRSLQRLSYHTQIQLEPYRCPSAENSRADDLSRGRISQESSASKFEIPLGQLFSSLLSL